MQNWKVILIAASILIVLFFLFYGVQYGPLDIQVDYLWFMSLGYESYFILKEGYMNLVDILVGSVFFSIFLINFRLTERFLEGNPENDGNKIARTRDSLIGRLIKTRLVRVDLPLSLLLTVPIMLPVHDNWESVVFFFYGDSATGIIDPAYQKDIGFYLFSYPLYELLQHELSLTFAMLLAAVALLYYLGGRKKDPAGRALAPAAKIHLNVLIIVLSLILLWGFLLDRYGLLYTSAHEPVFYGPGFVEMRYLLPLIWLECLALLIATFSLIHYRSMDKGRKTFVVSGIAFLVVFVLLHSAYLPGLLQKYWVQANPLATERDYMQYNIDSTLTGYGLDAVTKVRYDPQVDLNGISLDEKQDLNNIPVWEPALLGDVYKQLQTVRPYYDFNAVDVGRYTVEGYYQQVNLSAREIDVRKLPVEAQTWENIHLRYIHGYGAVITPAYQRGDKPMRCFLCDIEMNSPVGIHVKHPEVYYGTGHYTYAIAPNALEPVGPEQSMQKSGSRFEGSRGIPIDSAYLGKLLFALYFQEPNIFFSSAIDEHSRVLMHRNIRDRIKKLTPFLRLDSDPYLVVTEDRLYWIQDAYTTSEYYPNSKPSEYQFAGDKIPTRFNYIRNSIKIVVDAYEGRTEFYIVDPKDPIIRAYDRAFPEFFKPIEQMPDALKGHLRYPEDLFSIQLKIYAKYHQTKPELFYQESQSWSNAQMDGEPVQPYYVTIHKQGSDEQIFVSVAPMTLVGLDNLSALVLAGCFNRNMCSREYSPRILVLQFPGNVQVDGPGQVSALINQNPLISQKLTLWNQKGSEIKRGRMLILPIGDDILYIQPVYLLSLSRSRIPQLVRVIVSQDKESVIDTSLERALERITVLKETRVARESGVPTPASGSQPPERYIPPSQRKP